MKNSLLLVLVILTAATIGFAQNRSVYTSLEAKDCKTLEQEDEGAGWYRGECKGVAGFKLEVTEGDLRQSVNVVMPSGTIYELSFGSISSGFSSVGTKAEWRMKRKTPVALIIRFNASEDPEDSTKITSYLVVSKIIDTGACITDIVRPAKNQNALAQKLADTAAKRSCRGTD
ncbi:MAG: hypothetical protein IPN69_02665 [Acidobacteria bacterium]|nr:hypothetical protein [Acidobacteriota bacterium]